jgi:hypothetical protein
MATEIGRTLRETRTKRRIELTEAEASTKIRIRFLRAMENEEWDVLPGGSYTRGFIRTYARYLGLDGEQLADEYRRQQEGRPVERAPRAQPAVNPRASRGQLPSRRRLPSLSRGAWATLVSVGLIAILVGVALAGGGGGDSTSAPPGKSGKQAAGGETTQASGGAKTTGETTAKTPTGAVELSLAAKAEVWVCLLDAAGEPLVAGEILEAGAQEGPFTSRSFTMSFGNGEVDLRLDGEPAPVEETPSPIGYKVEAGGGLEPLAEAERPTCT